MDVTYYIEGLLRQGNAALARNYLGVGSGTGDVIGPVGAVSDNLASFDGATGKLIKDSGTAATNIPSSDQKAALSGTDGVPGAGNKYVTDSDPRNSDSRAPTTHATTHENGGGDEISVAGLFGQLADPQPVTTRKNSGADIGTRPRLNFIEGANVTLTVADSVPDNEVTVTIASTAGGTGDVVGPAGATDKAIARFDTGTGKLLKNSTPLVEDDGRISTLTDPTGIQDASTKNYVDTQIAALKRGVMIALCAAYTPLATGGDTAEIPVPYSPSDGTTVLTWNVRRIDFRVSMAGGAPSVRVEKSTATGAFSAATVGDVTLGSGAYEGANTTSLGTVQSGNKLRFNPLTLATATGWAVIVELEET